MTITTRKTSLKPQLNDKSVRRRKKHAAAVDVDTAAGASRRNDLQPKLVVQERLLSELRAADLRTRRSSPEQLERVIHSLRTFGVVTPVLIDSDARIVAGHVVVEACRRLGLRSVECIEISHLSEPELRQLRIALNRIGETGEWDIDELRLELIELDALDLDLSITGFSLPELDIIMAESDLSTDAEKQVPEPPTSPVSRPGDLWLLGQHRILCGDALSPDSYVHLLDGKVAHAVFSDPPYNCKIEGFVGGLGKHKHGDFAMAVGEMDDAGFHAFLSSYLRSCSAHLTSGAVLFACMDWRQVHLLVAAGKAEGLSHINTVVWNKGSGGMGGLYRSAHEMIVVFCTGKTPATNNVALGKHGRDRTNVWTYAGANKPGSSAAKALAGHPTPKPVEMVVDALLDVTERDDIVVDPFLGSGTTIIAAEKAGRIGYGIELDPAYVDLCVNRWEEVTGKEAILASTQATFAQTGEARTDEGDAPGASGGGPAT